MTLGGARTYVIPAAILEHTRNGFPICVNPLPNHGFWVYLSYKMEVDDGAVTLGAPGPGGRDENGAGASWFNVHILFASGCFF